MNEIAYRATMADQFARVASMFAVIVLVGSWQNWPLAILASPLVLAVLTLACAISVSRRPVLQTGPRGLVVRRPMRRITIPYASIRGFSRVGNSIRIDRVKGRSIPVHLADLSLSADATMERLELWRASAAA